MQNRKENRFTASWGGYIKLITKEEFENACVLVSNGVILIINWSPKGIFSHLIHYNAPPKCRNAPSRGVEKRSGGRTGKSTRMKICPATTASLKRKTNGFFGVPAKWWVCPKCPFLKLYAMLWRMLSLRDISTKPLNRVSRASSEIIVSVTRNVLLQLVQT